MQQHLDWLGYEVRDRVTGYAGVVSSICFDLYGCVQAAVTPKYDPAKKDDEHHGRWVDIKRLVKAGTRVMEAPKFPPAGEENGPAEKPAPVR